MATSRKPSDAEPTPPGAAVVASRALMVAALMERARLETARDPARFQALSTWVKAHGLFTNLGADGIELFDAPLGTWSEDDVDAVGWTTEELQLLLWALGQVEFPSLEVPADGAALLPKVPLLGEPAAFLAAVTLRPADEVEDKAQLYEALNEALRSEVYARSLKEDPKSLEADEDLEELLRSVAAEGFDRAAAATKGKVNEAVQGLRFWARTLLLELFGEGSPHLAYRLDPTRLLTLADGTLATMLALADARSGGLAWLREGDAGDTGADQPDDD